MQLKLPEWLNTLISIWWLNQTELPKVFRWGSFVSPHSPGRQNSLQHTHALVFAGIDTLCRIDPARQLDWQLLITCWHVHDIGEGILGEDKTYNEKSDAHDAHEYRAFASAYSELTPLSYAFFQRAFLLQFCLKAEEGLKHFPHDAQEIMRELATTKRAEALVFAAVEKFDYLLFACKDYNYNKNLPVLLEVLDKQIKELNELAEQIPNFGKEIWTEELRQHFTDFYAQHKSTAA